MQVEGVTFVGDDELVGKVRIAAWDDEALHWVPRAVSDKEGAYEFWMESPSQVAVMPWRGEPETWCVGVPANVVMRVPDGAEARMVMQRNDFRVPEVCRWTVQVRGLQEATTLHGRVGGVPFQAPSPAPRDSVVRVDLPCALEALAILGDAGGAGPGGALHPVTAGGGAVALPSVATTMLQLAPDALVPGLAIHDGVGWVRPVPDEGRMPVREGAVIEAWAPGRRTSVLDLSSGTTLRGTWDGSTWSPALAPARDVPVTCAGSDDGACSVEVACAAEDEAQGDPCGWHDGGLVCACPVGPAVLIAAGKRVALPEAATTGALDLRDVGAMVSLTAAPDCVVQAVRLPSWRDVLWAPPEPTHATARCDADGSVGIGPLPSGTWSIRLTSAGRSGERSVTVDHAPVALGSWTP